MINALRNLEREINVLNRIKGTYEIYENPVIVVVQSLSCVQLCDPMECSLPVSCPSLSPGVCSDSCSIEMMMLFNIILKFLACAIKKVKEVKFIHI